MRCNAGVDPKLLMDQHLIAEYREIPMIIGGLKKNNYIYKAPIPEKLCLGTGHMTFWKNKLLYLKKRWDEIVKEMRRRGFKTNIVFEIPHDCPKYLINDWFPSKDESMIIRNRIKEKILLKPTFYKWQRISIKDDPNWFISQIMYSKTYFV